MVSFITWTLQRKRPAGPSQSEDHLLLLREDVTGVIQYERKWGQVLDKGNGRGKKAFKRWWQTAGKKCSDKFNKTAMPCLVMLPYRRKTGFKSPGWLNLNFMPQSKDMHVRITGDSRIGSGCELHKVFWINVAFWLKHSSGQWGQSAIARLGLTQLCFYGFPLGGNT